MSKEYKKERELKLSQPIVTDDLFPDYETNEKGINIKLSFNFDEENIKNFGFRKINHYWHWHKFCDYKGLEISFDVNYYPDSSTFDIGLIDEDFGQYYPYQEILMKNRSHEYAVAAFNFVEEYMEHLQSCGIISGHRYGEYI